MPNLMWQTRCKLDLEWHGNAMASAFYDMQCALGLSSFQALKACIAQSFNQLHNLHMPSKLLKESRLIAYKVSPGETSKSRSTKAQVEDWMGSIRPFSYERIPLASGLQIEASLSVPEEPGVIGTQAQRPVGTAPSNGIGIVEKKLAVCLHPWSRLGGRMDDPYV